MTSLTSKATKINGKRSIPHMSLEDLQNQQKEHQEEGTVHSEAKSYYLATYGCQMNEYDSNLIAEMLEKRGLQEVTDMNEADVVIVNTCSIRGGAEDKAYARISSMRYQKRNNPNLKIAVVGCMAQNHGDKIPVSLEHVDYVVGPDNYQELEDKLFGEEDTSTQILTDQDDFENYSGLVAKIQSKVSAHVTIMRGCNKKCTYCIVPYVRGKERSRDPQEIEDEVRRAVDQGIPEITLLGQTVNSYRVPGENFAMLLRRLSKIEGLRRIRFTSPHPRHFTTDVIEAMAECDNISKHLHMPLQSGSNAMLKKMRRQYTRERFLEIVEEIREAIPNVGISTDIITGFVGETEEDYQDTLSLVEQVRFDSAFMFSYSPREGTTAFNEIETLTETEKSARLEKLIAIQNQITIEKLGEMVGKTEDILLEGPSHRSDSEWIGKTDCFKKVLVPYSSKLQAGQILPAHITELRGMTLAGNLVTP
jgi:tRNA-2-methylthio-N6-dimethylallyladenosine synthase